MKQEDYHEKGWSNGLFSGLYRVLREEQHQYIQTYMSTHNTILFYYSSQHPIKLKTNERPWSRGKTKTIFYRWNINPKVQYLNIWWCVNIISLFHSLLDNIIGMSALTRRLFCHQTFDFMEHKLFSLLKISHMYTLWSSLVECVERLYDIIS